MLKKYNLFLLKKICFLKVKWSVSKASFRPVRQMSVVLLDSVQPLYMVSIDPTVVLCVVFIVTIVLVSYNPVLIQCKHTYHVYN